MNLGHAHETRFSDEHPHHLYRGLPTPGVVHDQFLWQYLHFSQKFIGDYREGLFTDAKAKHAISEFQTKLEEISYEIEKRNASLAKQYRYPYLLPKRVPNSIAI